MGEIKPTLTYWAAVVFMAVVVIALTAATVLNFRPSMDRWPRMQPATQASESGIELRFIGTTGVVISDGTDTLVIDGFVTRPSLQKLLLSPIRPDADEVQTVRAMTGVETLGAIMVTHSHFDHAMDAPEWVRQAGGEVWGTTSTRNIASAEGIHTARIVSAGQSRTLGDFTVSFFDLAHAPKELMGGEIGDDFSLPAKASDYKSGGGLGFYFVYGQCRILAVPSAGTIHADLKDYPADIVLLSIGMLGKQDEAYIEKYWRKAVVDSGAKLVIPVHWDDFARSFEKPVKPLPYAVDRVDVAMRKITELAGDEIFVALPVLFEPLDLSASTNC